MLTGLANDGTRLRFALARYNTDGSPDAMFGTSGIVTSRVGISSAEVQAFVLQPDGKLVAAGLAFTPEPRCVLARYNANGTLDEGFGNAGVVLVGVAVDQSTFMERCFDFCRPEPSTRISIDRSTIRLART